MNIDAYMAEAAKLPNLSRKEETKLARAYRRGDEAAGQKLVAHHQRLAVKEAWRFKAYGYQLEDLIQEANLAMCRALRSFRPGRGFRFMTYARHWTNAYLHNYCAKAISLVCGGKTQAEKSLWRKGFAVYERIAHACPDLDREELTELAARECGVPIDSMRRVLARRWDRSLNEVVQQKTGTSSGDPDFVVEYQDLLRDPKPLADDAVARASMNRAVRVAVIRACKSPRERYIVERRLLTDDPALLSELGEKFGLSRERVRQIEAGILARARPALEAVL